MRDFDPTLYFQGKRYQIISQLGEGGIAQVWRVLDHKFDVERAIKIFVRPSQHSFSDSNAPKSNSEQRFSDEAKVLMHLNHPNIVTIYDSFEEQNQLHIVMERCIGSLDHWVEMNGPMPVKLAVQVCIEILKGLHYAHSKNIVHRDIKPHNILISEDSSIKIGDFGLAMNSFGTETLTKTNALLGSVQFMSPEQRNNPKLVSAKSDLYSTAMTLVWLLEQRIIGDLYLEDTLNYLSERYSVELLDCIRRAGQLYPEKRYDSAQAMILELEKLLPSLPENDASLLEVQIRETLIHHFSTESSAEVQLISEEIQLPSTIRYTLFGILFLLLILVGAVAGFFYLQSTPVPENDITAPSLTQTRKTVTYCESTLQSNQYFRHLGPEESNGALFVDIDQDNYLDATFSHGLGNTVSIYWGNPEFNFANPSEFPSKNMNGAAPLFGDLDRDGILDMVTLHRDSNEIAIHKGLGNRSFRGMEMYGRDIMLQSPSPTQGVLVDLDSDDYLDLFMVMERSIGYRLNAKKGLDYTIESIPNTEEEPLRWHKNIKEYSHDIFLSQNRPWIYWVEEGVLFRQKMQSSLQMGYKEILDKDIPDSSLQLVRTRPDGRDEIFFLSPSKELFHWIEEDDICILWKNIGEGAGSIWRRSFDVGDWNQDGILDYIHSETCWYCSSNHVLTIGEIE